MKPKVFVGSSVEGLNVAYSIQQNLTYDAEVTIWAQGVFELSKTTIESLIEASENFDFAIFVFNDDDILTLRNEKKRTVRDNVLFEFGLFIGKLGRDRVFFVIPSDTDLHIASDLAGITPGKYDSKREDRNLQAATGPVCHQVRMQMKKQGIISSNEEISKDPVRKDASFEEDKNTWIDFFLDREYDKAIKQLKEFQKSEKDSEKKNSLEAWLLYCKLKKGDSTDISELLELVEQKSDSLSIFLRVSFILLREDYVDKSIEITTKAIDKFGEKDELLINLSKCYSKIHGKEKALEFLESKNPEKSIEISLEIFNMYNSQENYEEARKVIHDVYENYPNSEAVKFNYAVVAIDLNENSIALYLLKSLTEGYPENYQYWGYLSNCCVQLDLYDNAFMAAKKANELSGEKREWIIANIGNMLKNRGFYSDGIEYLKKAIEIDKDSEYAHDRLATAIKLRQDEDKKLKELALDGRKLLAQSSFNASISGSE